jgi:hypothetical protein
MFGRLFGVILVTLFDGSEVNIGKFSEAQNGFPSLISELLNHFIASGGSSEQKRCVNLGSGRDSDEAKCDEEGFEGDEGDLMEMKRRLWENSSSRQEVSDRTVELIEWPASLLDS